MHSRAESKSIEQVIIVVGVATAEAVRQQNFADNGEAIELSIMDVHVPSRPIRETCWATWSALVANLLVRDRGKELPVNLCRDRFSNFCVVTWWGKLPATEPSALTPVHATFILP